MYIGISRTPHATQNGSVAREAALKIVFILHCYDSQRILLDTAVACLEN